MFISVLLIVMLFASLLILAAVIRSGHMSRLERQRFVSWRHNQDRSDRSNTKIRVPTSWMLCTHHKSILHNAYQLK